MLDVSAVTYPSGRQALQLAITSDGSPDEIAPLLVIEAENMSSARCFDDPCDHHTALEVAVCSGHVGAVERLLVAGADPNAPTHFYGTSVLQDAAAQGQLIAVRKLLEKGAHIDYCKGRFGESSFTPLAAATRAGHVEVCTTLLHAGADVSTSTYGDHHSALAMAAEVSSLPLLEVYLGVVADVAANFDPKDLQIATDQGSLQDAQRLAKTARFLKEAHGSIDDALMAASRAGNMLLLERLLDTNLNANAHKAIADAAASGHVNALTKLIKAATDQNDLPAHSLEAALQSAVDAGQTASIKSLMEIGANPAEINIQKAAANGHLDALTLILESGAEVNTPRSKYDDGTPLQGAVAGGYHAVVDLLLANGAYVNAWAGTYGPGGTALQIAIAGGHTEMAKRLLNEGADVNAEPQLYEEGGFSDSALQAAARAGNIAMIEILLAAGATVDTADMRLWRHNTWSSTALSIAAEGDHPQIVARLLALMSPDDARQTASLALEGAVNNRHTDVVWQLLQVHPDVNLCEPVGRNGSDLGWRPTLLQAAAANDDLEIVKMLLEEKADVNLNPSGGWEKTALQHASASGSLHAVKTLLDAGAKVNVTGSTAPPLLLAIRNGHVLVFKLLLAAGADIHATSYRGQTMLQAAEDSGDSRLLARVLHALTSRPQTQTQSERPPDRGTGPVCESCRKAPLIDVLCGRRIRQSFENSVEGVPVLQTPHISFLSGEMALAKAFVLHPSSKALRASAVAGCPFCCFIWRKLDIASTFLPQPSCVTLSLEAGEPCTIICRATEPFQAHCEADSHGPLIQKRETIFHFAIKPDRGKVPGRTVTVPFQYSQNRRRNGLALNADDNDRTQSSHCGRHIVTSDL